MNTNQKHPLPNPPPQAGEGANTCGTCASWTRHTDARMPDHGECTQRETGRYSHQATICLFETVRWSPKK